jgi:hypothetical protein
MNDLITVVTTTVANSCGSLNRQMLDLRKFTKVPFRQVVCDDGTLSEEFKVAQRDVVKSHAGGEWFENPGPTYGVSYNLNAAFAQVNTPWAFCVEDGLRASQGWLETALDAVEKIGNRQWLHCPVGAIGTSWLQEWSLAIAGVLPTVSPVMDHVYKPQTEPHSAFWGSKDHYNWNDGYWCWKRILPGTIAGCYTTESDTWQTGTGPGDTRNFIREQVKSYEDFVKERDKRHGAMNPEWLRDVNNPGGLGYATWPTDRRARCSWGASPFALINMEAWRQCGKWRDGCTFFEGHLGVRMAQHGYLWVYTQFPPWLHFAGMGFSRYEHAKTRHHEPCETAEDGTGGILYADFGCNGKNHVELFGPGGVVERTFPASMQRNLNEELAGVELWMEPGWKEWL